AGRPAQERIGGGLGQPLAHDDPLALVLVFAGAGEPGQHRLLRLLHLQEQRLVGSVADQQHDERLSSDRPDADNLAREVAEVVAPQHLPPIGLYRVLVQRDSATQFFQDARVTLDREADDHRRSRADTVLSLHLVAHPQEGPEARATVRFRYIPVTATYGRLRLESVENPAY